jgi:hypothetical protein
MIDGDNRDEAKNWKYALDNHVGGFTKDDQQGY